MADEAVRAAGDRGVAALVLDAHEGGEERVGGHDPEGERQGEGEGDPAQDLHPQRHHRPGKALIQPGDDVYPDQKNHVEHPDHLVPGFGVLSDPAALVDHLRVVAEAPQPIGQDPAR